MRLPHRWPGAPLVLFALLAACSSLDDAIALRLQPRSTVLAPGETVQITATVVGCPDEPVVWAVVEDGGGSIDETGMYTAPPLEGTFHVKAYVGTERTTQTVEIRVVREETRHLSRANAPPR